MRMIAIAFLHLMFLGIPVSAAEGPATETVLAAAEAPDTTGWNAAERWKSESIDGKPVLRLAAGTGYARLAVTGDLPGSGMVMLRLHYHSTGKALEAGIGGWGAPTATGAIRPAGWQVEELAFPASSLRSALADGGIGLMIKGDGGGPAIRRMELLVPTAEQLLVRYRAWAREGLDAAFAAVRSGSFPEVRSDAPVVALAASADDQKLGALPIVRSYLSPILPGAIPSAEERTLAGRIAVPPGEYEIFQFGLHALRDFSGLVAELDGPAPAGLAAELCWLECAPVRVGGSRGKKARIAPSIVWPKEVFPSCDARAGESRAWYAIVRAAPTAAAGEHPLRIAVKDGSRRLFSFTCTVRVLPFTLPTTRDLDRLFLVTDSGPVEDEATLRDLVEHGLNATATFNEYRPMNGQKQADFAIWDAYFARLKAVGLDRGFFWYLGNPESGNAVEAGVGAEAFSAMLRGLDERARDGRYPKHLFLSIDEAVCSGKAFAQSNQLHADCRQRFPALRVLGCSLDRFAHTVKYEGHADMLACNGSFAENAAWCREKGVLLNMYSSVSYAAAGAVEARLRYGFTPWQHGAFAVNGWALRWYNGHPFNCLDAGVTDWACFYPNWTGGRPISTPCWEGLRQGINDQRYLAVLERLVTEGRSDGKLLAELRRDGIGKVAEAREQVRGDSNFGVSGDAPDVEIARARVIQEILKAGGK